MRVPVGSELCRFDQYCLKMLVAFLGDRPPGFFASRLPLGAAQTAVADGLTSGKTQENKGSRLQIPNLIFGDATLIDFFLYFTLISLGGI
jgi:hypothetical protein